MARLDVVVFRADTPNPQIIEPASEEPFGRYGSAKHGYLKSGMQVFWREEEMDFIFLTIDCNTESFSDICAPSPQALRACDSARCGVVLHGGIVARGV